MPHGNVDDRLTLADGVLMVCGPILWNGVPPDTPARSLVVDSVHVVIEDTGSGDPLQIGSERSRSPFQRPADEWMATVDVKPVPGAGTKVGVTVRAYVNVRGGVEPETWIHSATVV